MIYSIRSSSLLHAWACFYHAKTQFWNLSPYKSAHFLPIYPVWFHFSVHRSIHFFHKQFNLKIFLIATSPTTITIMAAIEDDIVDEFSKTVGTIQSMKNKLGNAYYGIKEILEDAKKKVSDHTGNSFTTLPRPNPMKRHYKRWLPPCHYPCRIQIVRVIFQFSQLYGVITVLVTFLSSQRKESYIKLAETTIGADCLLNVLILERMYCSYLQPWWKTTILYQLTQHI